MMNRKDIDEILVDLYKLNHFAISSNNSSLFNELREDGMSGFIAYKLPTKKDEDYKYSDVSAWLATAIGERSAINTKGGGDFRFEQNREGVVICDMNTFAAEYGDIFRKYYTKSVEDNSLMMLSRAFATGGKVVYVPKNCVCDKVITLSVGSCEGEISLGERNLFIFERGSLAKVHVDHHDDGVVNSVSEIFVDSSANVEFSELYHGSSKAVVINSISANVMRDAFYRHTSINLSCGNSRVNQYVTLADSGANATIYGAVLAGGDAHIDNSTLITHAVENCQSYESFKCVALDGATSIFNGNVYVTAGANGTQAYQQNNNILIGDKANVYSKPNLEIYADDVKCSHGATVGQLDEEALFYMRQRGVSTQEAKRLMLLGFVKDIVNKISTEEIVERISEELENV